MISAGAAARATSRAAALGERSGGARTGLGRGRKVQYPGSSVACTSAIALPATPRAAARRAQKIESRNGPERPPRPPQPSRVRHTRAGAASWRAAAPVPRGRRPQGSRDPRGHRSAGRRAGGAGTPPGVGHGRGARHRHRPCTGRGGVRKVSGAARAASSKRTSRRCSRTPTPTTGAA